MVGWLVQQQNLKRKCQRFRKRHLFLLSSRKVLYFHLMVRDSKFVERTLHLTFQCPVIFRYAVKRIRQNRCIFWKHRMLRKIREANPILLYNLSLIRLLHTCNHTQQSRFPGTIDSNNPNFIPLLNSKRDIIKNRLFAKYFTDMFYIQYVHFQHSSFIL